MVASYSYSAKVILSTPLQESTNIRLYYNTLFQKREEKTPLISEKIPQFVGLHYFLRYVSPWLTCSKLCAKLGKIKKLPHILKKNQISLHFCTFRE